MARDKAYRIAEQKIEEARRSRAKELDLRGGWGEESAKLAELPESLGELTWLESLDLSNNQLTALPDSLGQLTQLGSLSVEHNQLSDLPESLGRLTQLQYLNLIGNRLRSFP